MKAIGNVKVNLFQSRGGSIQRVNWYVTSFFKNGMIKPIVWEQDTEKEMRPLFDEPYRYEEIDFQHPLTDQACR